MVLAQIYGLPLPCRLVSPPTDKEKGKHFTPLSLYKPKDSMDYTMSWVISQHVPNAMDECLYNYDKVTELVRDVRDGVPA